MTVDILKLQHFKNYESATVSFSPGINCLVGLNGAGKTNLLDALHYLAFSKSAFLPTDLQNIQDGQQYFLVDGTFAENTLTIKCYQEKRKKKQFKVDDQEVSSVTDLLGRIPMVLTTPYDSAIIREGGEVRRKFANGAISQHDPDFLQVLIHYRRTLRQRNSFLKSINGSLNAKNEQLLELYDDKLISLSKTISTKRASFILDFYPCFEHNYNLIADAQDKTSIAFESDALKKDFEQVFRSSRERDLILQRTNIGSHKDDFTFLLKGEPLKKYGSQGQQKSFLIALRLAQYDYLYQKMSNKPILLLDDIFDKLDDERIERLAALLAEEDRFGQVIITDARKERSKQVFKKYRQTQFFEVINGELAKA
ncbi:MAG: DNA replication and repair protein RecF [Cyclobacteriaceae bacterium]|nr:DNA replication and repair protein RecF [Cyclobacteriaceae bacterium HetDA_MAG_MS6]